MAGDRRAHGIGMLLPEARAPLDVGEEEGDGAGREVRHRRPRACGEVLRLESGASSGHEALILCQVGPLDRDVERGAQGFRGPEESSAATRFSLRSSHSSNALEGCQDGLPRPQPAGDREALGEVVSGSREVAPVEGQESKVQQVNRPARVLDSVTHPERLPVAGPRPLEITLRASHLAQTVQKVGLNVRGPDLLGQWERLLVLGDRPLRVPRLEPEDRQVPERARDAAFHVELTEHRQRLLEQRSAALMVALLPGHVARSAERLGHVQGLARCCSWRAPARATGVAR